MDGFSSTKTDREKVSRNKGFFFFQYRPKSYLVMRINKHPPGPSPLKRKRKKDYQLWLRRNRRKLRDENYAPPANFRWECPPDDVVRRLPRERELLNEFDGYTSTSSAEPLSENDRRKENKLPPPPKSPQQPQEEENNTNSGLFDDWVPPSPERAFRGYDEPLLPEMELHSDVERHQQVRQTNRFHPNRFVVEDMQRWQDRIRDAFSRHQDQDQDLENEVPPALRNADEEEARGLENEQVHVPQEDEERQAFQDFYNQYRLHAREPRPRVRETRFEYALFLARIRAYGSMSRDQLDDIQRFLIENWSYLQEVFQGHHGNLPATTRHLITDVKRFTPTVRLIVWTKDPTTNVITQHEESQTIDKKTMKRKDVVCVKAYIKLMDAVNYHIRTHYPEAVEFEAIKEKFPLLFDLSSDGVSPAKSGTAKMHVTSISFASCGSVLPLQVFWGTNSPDCEMTLRNIVDEVNELKHLLVLRRSIHDGAERKIVMGMRNVNYRMVCHFLF